VWKIFTKIFEVLFAAAFGNLFMRLLAVLKPFHDTISGFQRPFKPIGIEN
jgi:hypothetical protein